MIAPGDPLAPFTLLDAQGKALRWKPGTATLITVVAFWCDTWKEQTARLAAVRTALRGIPVAFLTVSIDGRWAERGAGLGTIGRDLDGAWSRALGIRAVPFTLLVDAGGTVRHAAQGISRADTLVARVRTLLLSPPLAGEGGGKRAAGGDRGEVYLTFDDFPQPEDDLLLDCLRRFGAKATFFCLGVHLEERHALARRALAEGHALQVHSWDHVADHPQLARCTDALRRLGATPTLYRPPGQSTVQRLSGAPLSLQLLTPFDETRPGESELRRRLLLALRPGMTVQLHAGVAETRAVLPELLQTIQRRGWVPALL